MKKYALIIIGIILMTCLTVVVVKKNHQLIIQGEVDTKSVDLSSKITGRVKTINVKEGDTVKAGQVLITLDTPDIEAKKVQANAALELAESKRLEVLNGARNEQKAMALNALHKAQSDLKLAQKTYNRLHNLNKEGVISNQKADEAYTQFNNAKQAVLIAQNNYQMLENGSRYEDKLIASAGVKQAQGSNIEVQSYLDENKIISPISGQVTEISVEEGELVGSGYTIITVVDTDDNWVVFNLREDLLPKFKMGTVFDATVPALSKKPIKVKVNFISAMGNFATWRATKIRGDFDLKTFEIHAKPLEKNPDLRAGMSVITDYNKIGK
ncbi:HlyD family secretion protein [bacterium]|nr:HlyD family secretion protein [bacterium]